MGGLFVVCSERCSPSPGASRLHRAGRAFNPAVVNISTSQKRAMPFKLPKGFELPKDLDIILRTARSTNTFNGISVSAHRKSLKASP